MSIDVHQSDIKQIVSHSEPLRLELYRIARQRAWTSDDVMFAHLDRAVAWVESDGAGRDVEAVVRHHLSAGQRSIASDADVASVRAYVDAAAVTDLGKLKQQSDDAARAVKHSVDKLNARVAEFHVPPEEIKPVAQRQPASAATLGSLLIARGYAKNGRHAAQLIAGNNVVVEGVHMADLSVEMQISDADVILVRGSAVKGARA
ncbi:hypothetical protein AA23498_2727 [Acetobacter nitrogenifigens DSM 23921 = NBRC 105050]|uniref:RNA-binding S4 domain-containing protein n=1 Tax=Acetobacter nitrogenifigens DSM 23921 = NBRC 105050 TaxID=1120919 RepID=A0A511XDT6_9PROT|nr:hypothetical protein [Acetobacter nitrogenifigens]GBQ96770.1 hypothetical protein AA23498_2727 [Acetobacter nitrogenifigens DSM 23921 = NBRC 105050]GEN61124.1 hypothetical protein ANI02nite_30080 [Acetobacter nitrogenifigens DSM 23921 = NBRC 105050]